MTGHDLKLIRVAADVSAIDLAAAMKIDRSTISRWESSRKVTRKAADRYVAGLATFGPVPTVTVETPDAVA